MKKRIFARGDQVCLAPDFQKAREHFRAAKLAGIFDITDALKALTDLAIGPAIQWQRRYTLRIGEGRCVEGDVTTIDFLSRELERLEAYDRDARRAVARKDQSLEDIEADLRRTYDRPAASLTLNFDKVASLDAAALESYQHIPADIKANGWGEDLSHKQGH
ncbi:hypothetical protein [Asticcacaulis machinosus]|uniref:Uncharacterized protein n=1 Tax=Asticcacaulis machinosus TaxID=2984211 RepID=A0ABT5HGT2_9CAUL|nr:hypothetical protein [Asticcacaulis machinosus]MDC7675402.1 hypothetical protein [Asticcacaulis machinosus]